jgi:hypothetical protein
LGYNFGNFVRKLIRSPWFRLYLGFAATPESFESVGTDEEKKVAETTKGKSFRLFRLLSDLLLSETKLALGRTNREQTTKSI